MSLKDKLMSMIHRGKRPEVFISIELDRPLGAITESEPKGKAFVKVIGLTLEQAAKEFPGKSLAWERIRFDHRAKLEIEPFNFEIKLEDFRKILR